jgi:hypothetical protein
VVPSYEFQTTNQGLSHLFINVATQAVFKGFGCIGNNPGFLVGAVA